MTAKTLMPRKLAPTREGDYILITIPNHWARGETLAQAKANLKSNGGRLGDVWRVHSVHPSTYVDVMGYINAPGDHEPVMLAENNPS